MSICLPLFVHRCCSSRMFAYAVVSLSPSSINNIMIAHRSLFRTSMEWLKEAIDAISGKCSSTTTRDGRGGVETNWCSSIITHVDD